MNDQSNARGIQGSSSSSSSGLSGERRAAIRARLESVCECGHGEGLHTHNWKGEPKELRHDCGKCACELFRPRALTVAPSDVRDLLAAVDQITLERDSLSESAAGFVNRIHEMSDRLQQAGLDYAAVQSRAEQAEAALVVLTQRQHTKLNVIYRRLGVVVPACDGPECELCKALGLLGSAVPEDAPR